MVERAVVLSRGPALAVAAITIHGPTPVQSPGLPSLKLHKNVEWAERETVRRALGAARGVKKDAAEIMGISQRALSHYLGKYKLGAE